MADEIASDAADQRWTVRGVTKGYREAATAAADRAGMSVGAWLCQVIDEAVQAEREPIGTKTLAPKTPAGLTTPELADLMRSMAALATATGVPPAKADLRRAYVLADDHVRVARGMPPRPTRLPPAKAKRQLALEGKAEAEQNSKTT
jgi:hypothetical protein